MSKTAILLGATGLTGSHLLDLLLKDDTFKKVKVFTRRETGIKHPKLEEYIIDLLQLDQHEDKLKGDVLYCCIGTTKAKTSDKQVYHKIDYGIPVTAAQLAKKNNIQQYFVISSLGANEKSRVFYSRTKGEMERDVLKEKIENTYIFQPSLIVGKRDEKRFSEDLSNALMRIFNGIIPKKYKRILALDIAKAMLYVTKNNYTKTIIPSDEIQDLSKK